MTIDRSKLRKAEKLVAHGKLKPAVDAYLKVLRSEPDDANVNNIVGDLLVRLDEKHNALPYFRRAATTFENSGFRTKAIATLRKAYRQTDDDPAIARELAELLKREGLAADARSVLFELAFKREKLGDVREAKKIYYQVLDIDPHHVQSLIKISEIAEREGDEAEEARVFGRIIKNLAQSARYEEAEEMLDNMDPRFRNNPELNKIKADIYVRVGRMEEAKKLLNSMQSHFPEDPDLLITLAKVALRSGDIDKADLLYNKVIETKEPDEETNLLGAGLKISRGEYDEALRILQPMLDHVLETNTESPAIIAVEEITKRNPEHLGALKKLKQIYTYLKDKNNLVRILVTLTDAYEKQGDHKLAIDAVEQLIGLEPEKLAHKNRLEQLYELSGGAAMFDSDSATVEEMDLPDSIDFNLDDEVNSEGLDPKVHRHLVEAGVFLKFGLTKKARQQLNSAAEIDEFEPRIYERLGEIYLEEKETTSAIKSYEKARECWQRRNDSGKAREMEAILSDLSEGRDNRPDLVLDEKQFEGEAISLDFVDEEAGEDATSKESESVEWLANNDPLQGKLAEAEYYIEQNFITAAQHLLDKLNEQYPGNQRVGNLRISLENKLKSEMDMTTMDKDLDDFFSGDSEDKAQHDKKQPTGEPSAFRDMINLLEDDISEIGSLASKKADQLGNSSSEPMDRLISHGSDEEYMRTALSEDSGKHFDMGVAYMEAELFDESIQSFKIAAKNPRFYQKACLQLGICYLSKGMENVAVTWLQKCFTGGGNEQYMADALHQMAIIYQLQGEDAAFLNAVEQLESLDAKYPGLKTLKSIVDSMKS